MSYSTFIVELKKALAEKTDFTHEIVFTKSKSSVTDKYSLCIPEYNNLSIPSMGLDYFYSEYEKGRSIEDIASNIEDIYLSKLSVSNKPNLVWESVKNHLVYQLINFTNNETNLMQYPYFQIGDMAIIFKIDSSYLGIDGFISVSYEVYEMLKTNLLSLVEAALVNTPALFPINLINVTDVFPDFIAGTWYSAFNSKTSDLWIASNPCRKNGAAVIFYKEIDKLLKSKGYSDAFIIPLSIHEALVAGYSKNINKEVLQEILLRSNASPLITKVNHLSDKIYLYSELMNMFEAKINTLKTNMVF